MLSNTSDIASYWREGKGEAAMLAMGSMQLSTHQLCLFYDESHFGSLHTLLIYQPSAAPARSLHMMSIQCVVIGFMQGSTFPHFACLRTKAGLGSSRPSLFSFVSGLWLRPRNFRLSTHWDRGKTRPRISNRRRIAIVSDAVRQVRATLEKLFIGWYEFLKISLRHNC